MSELKVNKISPQSGTAFTLGDSGDTFTVPSGATLTVSGTFTQTGAQTFDGGVEIDNFTINGSEIDLSSGDMTLDVAGDIILDADGGEVLFHDATTAMGHISMDSSNITLKSLVSDKDIIFQGNDGGAGITALTLDMSAAGAATFNNNVTVGDNLNMTTDSSEIAFGADSDVKIIHSADSGLILKHTATADDKPINLILQTGETDRAADDVMGKISFQAPDEGTGTDAILVAAAIQAVAEGDFSSSSNATRLEFMTGSSEAATSQMSISSGGIVGIGAVPTGDLGVGLHIKTADSGQGSAPGNADELIIEGSGHAGLAILSGNSSTGNIFFGDDGASDIGQIRYDHDDNDLIFRSNNGDRGRFDSNGDFLVSCTSLPSASVKGFGIDNKGSIGMIVTATNTTSADSHYQTFNPNGQVGSIQTSGTSTSFNTSSDYRLKENVDYTWDATTRLKQLKPARFNFISDENNTLVDGFLAHEVSSIVPEAIAGTKDAVESGGAIIPQQIDQSKLVPLLVKTVQELEARIKTLEDA